MIRAFSTLGCPELDFEGVLSLAARFGLGAVELRALEGTVDVPGVLARAFGDPARLAERMRGSAVAVAAFGTSMRLLSPPQPGDREALLRYVPWAEAVGAKLLRVFDGGVAADEAELRRARDTLDWWAGLRAARGWAVDLAVETHDSLVTTAALERFMVAAPEAGLLWDTHHTWRRGGAEPDETWAAIGARVRHIHVKDSVDDSGADPPFRYVSPGQGAFPMPALRATLAGAGFNGTMSLEWERMWHKALPPLPVALRDAAEREWW